MLETCGPHPEHDAMFDVEQDLLLLPVVSDESVEGVTVRHPANKTRVSGQGDHGVPLDTVQKTLCQVCVI